ncbi:MAG: hypothetical protein ABIR26_06945 [Ramlibacter sp.]
MSRTRARAESRTRSWISSACAFKGQQSMDQVGSISFAALRTIVADAKDDAVLKGKVGKGGDGKVTQLFLKAGRSPTSFSSLVGILTGKRKEQTAQARELIQSVVDGARGHAGLKSSMAAQNAISNLEQLLAGKGTIRAIDVRGAFETLAQEDDFQNRVAQEVALLGTAVKSAPPLRTAAANLLGKPSGQDGAPQLNASSTLRAANKFFNNESVSNGSMSAQLQSALETLKGHSARMEQITLAGDRKKKAEKEGNESALNALKGNADISIGDAISQALGKSALLKQQKLSGPNSVLGATMQLMIRAEMLVGKLEEEAGKAPSPGLAAKFGKVCEEFVNLFPAQLATLKSMAAQLNDPSAFAHLKDDAPKMIGETAKALNELISEVTDLNSPYIKLYQFAQAAQANPAAALAQAQAAVK